MGLPPKAARWRERVEHLLLLCVAGLCGTWEPWRLEGREVMEVTQTRKSRPFLRSPLPGGWVFWMDQKH